MMNIQLNITYKANASEALVVNILDDKGEEAKVVTPHSMVSTDRNLWICTLQLRLQPGTSVDYYYSVVDNKGMQVRSEWTAMPHRLELNSAKSKKYIIFDQWIDMPEDAYKYSSAFTKCLHARELSPSLFIDYRATLSIKVRAPQLRSKERLLLVGNLKALGEWDVARGVTMTEHNYNEWVAYIDWNTLTENTIEYKFVVAKEDSDGKNGEVIWEDRYNRLLKVPVIKDGTVVVYEVGTALFPITDTRCAGTLVPVFSLKSDTSFGVGDFGDLKKFIDWIALTQQRILQILPINDTTITHTWTDSYPYCSISIFALHPQYVDLTALPQLADKKQRKAFERLRKKLNALPQIDYEKVNRAKNDYLMLLYAQEGGTIMATNEFKLFFVENESWLVPYAQYSFFRDKYGTADFSTWTGHQQFNEKDRKTLSDPRTKAYHDVAYFYFVQFILHIQLASVHDYARQKGVVLKGDIPIGVSRNGCDVWQEPRYFNLEGQAGAPPDNFSKNGQNWGFPTYNWEEMLKDDCYWWMQRFANMAKFFDAYRIDHVLGFFRIWEIPIHSVHGLLGQFVPSLALSREEIESYGLHFQEELFTEPFITDWVLSRTFGDEAEKVRESFLIPTHDGRYMMRPEYNTQRKIEAHFVNATRETDIRLRDGLYALVSDVLFVRDHSDINKFHPRISAQFDFVHEALYDKDKASFNKLYNDYYYQRNNHFWYQEAMKKLPKIVSATRMLACAEDLGMVPECVAWAMNELKIFSLELQSMPKDPYVAFGILDKNPYRSVCTISSHDTPTLRQWWDEDYDRTQNYYNTVLGKYGTAPHPLPGWLARDVIARHLRCPSMLCILAIQDWLALDEDLRLANTDAERVNIPANPHHYWRYRMHLTIEQLLASNTFNQNIADLIKENGRN